MFERTNGECLYLFDYSIVDSCHSKTIAEIMSVGYVVRTTEQKNTVLNLIAKTITFAL